MKKSIFWKITASALMIALVLPLFSAISPISVSAAPNAPFPYAMEAFGQKHGGIYSASSAPGIDGVKDASYTEIGRFNSSSLEFFSSTDALGTVLADPASEYLPKEVTLAASYDAENIYFYITAEAREDEIYTLDLKGGCDFGEAQPVVEELASLSILHGSSAVVDPSGNYYIKTEYSGNYTDYMGEHSLYRTTYEVAIELPEAVKSGEMDRMYFSLSLRYMEMQPLYWIYGVPNNVSLPSGYTAGAAFEEDGLELSAFTPQVIEFLGEKGSGEKPAITSTLRTDENTTDARSFKSTLSVAAKSDLVKEIGVLKSYTSALAGKNAVIGSAEKISSMDVTGTDAANGTIVFDISAEDYETFVSLRPYAEYTDGTVVYGDYYTISSLYYDLGKMDYQNGELKILMIGSSANYYYLDELVSLGASEGYYLTVANTYFSGCPVQNEWLWLMNDYSYSKNPGNGKSDDGDIVEFSVRTPDFNPNSDHGAKMEERSIAEALAFADWDIIAVMGSISRWQDDEKGAMKWLMPYLPNIYRYLEINHPDAEHYLLQSWEEQVGYCWQIPIYYTENGDVDQTKSTPKPGENTPAARMDTVAQQDAGWEATTKVTNYFSEVCDIGLVPIGTAWHNARKNTYDIGGGQKVKVGDILCNKGPDGDGSSGDCSHDGTTGGGQYLNALVWFELFSGKSCVGTEWRPTKYEVREDRALALQLAAHEAIATYYGADFAK